MFDWVQRNPVWVWWIGGVSLMTLIVSLALLPVVVVRMRADFFLDEDRSQWQLKGRHPALRLAGRVAKNALGWVLLLSGVAMLVLPGQGVLTILVGLTLLDFPGKRALELRIARQRHVLNAINWIRERAGRPPLLLPDR